MRLSVNFSASFAPSLSLSCLPVASFALRKPPTSCGSPSRPPAPSAGSWRSPEPMASTRRPTSTSRATELATTEAGKIALVGGGADMILSDWLWVARERSLGKRSCSIRIPPRSAPSWPRSREEFGKPSDFVGKKLGVAGGPLDKSWLMLQAWALQAGRRPEEPGQYRVRRAAAARGKTGAGRTRRRARILDLLRPAGSRKASRRAVDMSDVERDLGAKGPVIVTGYVFTEAFAARARPGAGALLRHDGQGEEADRRRRRRLREDRAVKGRSKDARRLRTGDAAANITARACRRGRLAADESDAAAIFSVLARSAARQLVGAAKDIDPERVLPSCRAAAKNDPPKNDPAAFRSRCFSPLWQIGAWASGRITCRRRSPSARLWSHEARSGELPFNLGVTLTRVLAGFVLAMASGSALGLALGRNPRSTGCSIPGW